MRLVVGWWSSHYFFISREFAKSFSGGSGECVNDRRGIVGILYIYLQDIGRQPLPRLGRLGTDGYLRIPTGLVALRTAGVNSKVSSEPTHVAGHFQYRRERLSIEAGISDWRW